MARRERSVSDRVRSKIFCAVETGAAPIVLGTGKIPPPFPAAANHTVRFTWEVKELGMTPQPSHEVGKPDVLGPIYQATVSRC